VGEFSYGNAQLCCGSEYIMPADLSAHPLVGRCDVVLSTEVVEHIYPPRIYARNCYTALRDYGKIKFWSRRTLSLLLEEAGFEMTGFHGVGRMPFLWKSMIVTTKKRSG